METDSAYYESAFDNRPVGNNLSPFLPFSVSDVTAAPHAASSGAGTSFPSNSSQLPGHRSDFTISPAPRFLSMSLPATSIIAGSSTPSTTRARKRGRPPLTSEYHPPMEDSQVLISLGMSPFMPGQDVIGNQNRFVRNEAILSRHLSSLKRSYAQLESNQARLAEDVHRVLDEHKARSDGRTAAPTDTRAGDYALKISDAEFTTLRQNYAELRQTLNAIIHYIFSTSASSRGGFADLDDILHRLSPRPLGPMPPPSRHAPSETTNIQHNTILSPTTLGSIPPPEVGPGTGTGPHSYLNPSVSPFRLARPLISVGFPLEVQPFSDSGDGGINAAESYHAQPIIYGPISNADDRDQSMAAVNEALRNVGLNATTLRSVHPAPGRANYLSLEFLKDEDASRFVKNVGVGHDGHPLAQVLYEGDSGLGASHLSADEPRKPAFELGTRPWQL